MTQKKAVKYLRQVSTIQPTKEKETRIRLISKKALISLGIFHMPSSISSFPIQNSKRCV